MSGTQRLPEQLIAAWLPRTTNLLLCGKYVKHLDRESLLSAVAYLNDREKVTQAELSRRTRFLLGRTP